jgi:hypothetical protein
MLLLVYGGNAGLQRIHIEQEKTEATEKNLLPFYCLLFNYYLSLQTGGDSIRSREIRSYWCFQGIPPTLRRLGEWR